MGELKRKVMDDSDNHERGSQEARCALRGADGAELTSSAPPQPTSSACSD